MKVKALLFDLDGTLLNTHEYLYQAFEYALEKHHKPLSRSILQKIMGKPLVECYQMLTNLPDVSAFTNSHTAFQKKNPQLVVPFTHTISTLEKLKEKGMLLAVVTTRARNTVIETLEGTEIMHYLDYLVAFDDVVEPKPSPEGILKALTYFELQPNQTIMIGDSDVDVMAGKNAKTKTVGVTYGFHGEKIKDANPDFVIDDIREVAGLLT